MVKYYQEAKGIINNPSLFFPEYSQDCYDIYRELISQNPVLKKVALEVLPYSIGIEFETPYKAEPSTVEVAFLLDYCVEKHESTFRIQPGLKGLISLYQITKFLEKHYLFNTGSGIHYHVDLESFKADDIYKICPEKKVLEILDKWNYQGFYNHREVRRSWKGSWVNFRPRFNTIEFRIGEMTWDYNLLLKRIRNASAIRRMITDRHNNTGPKCSKGTKCRSAIAKRKILNRYKKQINRRISRIRSMATASAIASSVW